MEGGAMRLTAAESLSLSLSLSRGVSRAGCAASGAFRPRGQQLRLGGRVGTCRATAGAADSQNGGTRVASAAFEKLPLEFGEVVVEGDEEAVDDDAKIKLECDESGCVWVVGKNVSGLEDNNSEGYLHCGFDGCYYDTRKPRKDFKVVEGAGWRLGFDTAPESEESFCAVVGAGGWSVALTASEFNDFTQVIQTLRKGIVTMEQDGVIGRDKVEMKVRRGTVWMDATFPGKRLPSLQRLWKIGEKNVSKAFEISFQLVGDDQRRRAEGFWPAEAVLDMLTKVDELAASSTVVFEAEPSAPEEGEEEDEEEEEAELEDVPAIRPAAAA